MREITQNKQCVHLPEHLTRGRITSFTKNRNAPVSSMNKTGVAKQRRTPLAGGFVNRMRKHVKVS